MSEEFERALNRVAADQSPIDELAMLSHEERRMVRMAQVLHGSAGGEIRPGFAEDLRRQVLPSRRVSRRAAFLTGLGGLAAGLLAGLGLDRQLGGTTSNPLPAVIEPIQGRWVSIAKVAEVPEGSIRTFRAGAVQGFLLHRGGQYQALSRMCTHMACALNFQPDENTFLCPCHGAEFNLQGRQLPSEGYGYATTLPPLPRLRVRRNGDNVEVLTA